MRRHRIVMPSTVVQALAAGPQSASPRCRRSRSTSTSVVRAEVPVLRLQLARARGGAARGRVRRRADRRPRARAAVVWGRRVHSDLLRRRHAEPASRRGDRPPARRVRARLPLAPDAEITLEANPGTFEAEKFRDFRAAGVNRLSIGIQSFDPRAPEGARPRSTTTARRGARSRSRTRTSTTSTST